jgi:hypothetical protein
MQAATESQEVFGAAAGRADPASSSALRGPARGRGALGLGMNQSRHAPRGCAAARRAVAGVRNRLESGHPWRRWSRTLSANERYPRLGLI